MACVADGLGLELAVDMGPEWDTDEDDDREEGAIAVDEPGVAILLLDKGVDVTVDLRVVVEVGADVVAVVTTVTIGLVAVEPPKLNPVDNVLSTIGLSVLVYTSIPGADAAAAARYAGMVVVPTKTSSGRVCLLFTLLGLPRIE